ncbi:MAG: chemotaxis protein, partial [Leptolyngbyaceae cyanobacterium SM1_3_5]|nr:chemotaxis protein [Leptolyngbyaceae cyanobacterium SM1_3_5]
MTIEIRSAKPDDGWEQPERSPLSAAKPIAGVPTRTAAPLQWFYNLPVRRKQLFGLFASEAISIVGLVGVGSLLIVGAGRAQLVQQAKSELAVTDIEYNIRIDQMSFGFRGQAENAAIVEAAQTHSSGDLSSDLQQDVRRILANEVKSRNIEYATLIGTDGKIIANANRDRSGQAFDPQGLVKTILNNPRQITASAIVPWAELQQEAPPLPNDFSNQDALIRYVATPVINPDTQKLVGVLLSGDIVNGKAAIATETLEAFDSGYSAVYQLQPNGEFALATSAKLPDGADPDQVARNVALPNSDLLQRAVAAS